MRFLFTVAWRNLWRHRRRSLITAPARAVGMALCMLTIAFSDGMFEDMFEVMVEQQLGHVQVHHPDYPTSKVLFDTLPAVDELVARVEEFPGTVAVSPRLEGFALIGGPKTSAGGLLRGVEPAREAAVSPLVNRMKTGRFLAEEASGEILLGVGLAEELEVEVGASVVAVTQASDGSLGNELYEVVGTFQSGEAQLDRAGAVLHLHDLQRLLVLDDQAHGLTVLTADPDALDDYAQSLQEGLGGPGIEVQTWSEASPQTAQLMGMRDASTFIILGIVFGAAAFGVVNTMMMSVFERTRELGVLKALGMRPGQMVALIVFESGLLAALACAIGLVLGGLLDAWIVVYGLDMSGATEEGFSFAGVMLDPVIHGAVRWQPIAATVSAVFLVSALASLWPALRAARLRPVEAIRAE